ncbi:YqeB family protein [Actinorhabdospora filicis]|uniref:YqeB family protein n=1 Tax=Actinorhabdospora filicis TaxID=1785913 RepID=UPI0025573E7F|nr:hypothetical protein [Actinorhabdospora filicis]
MPPTPSPPGPKPLEPASPTVLTAAPGGPPWTWLDRRTGTALEVTGAEIVLVRPGGLRESLRRAHGWVLDTRGSGPFCVLRQYGNSSVAGRTLPLYGFDPAVVRDAAVAHGWGWHGVPVAPMRIRKKDLDGRSVPLVTEEEAARLSNWWRPSRLPLAVLSFGVAIGGLLAALVLVRGVLWDSYDLPKGGWSGGLGVASFGFTVAFYRATKVRPRSVEVSADRLTWTYATRSRFLAREAVASVTVGREAVFRDADGRRLHALKTRAGRERLERALRELGWPL